VPNYAQNGKERANATPPHSGRMINWRYTVMKFLLWLLLLVFCWPLALLALVLYPIVWLISIPFRIVGITFEALFAFLKTLLFLPSRVLGGKERAVPGR